MPKDSLDRHHQKWSALPAFPQWPYVMGDDDVEAWGDILYLRGLAEEIEDLCRRTSSGARDIPAAMSGLLGAAIEFGAVGFDRAAELLAAWRGDIIGQQVVAS